MGRWSEIESQAPELAALARRLMEAGVHKTIATLRLDGSPRISGIEARFAGGDLWFGSMPGSLKGRDLIRDPRFALHSRSDDPPDWPGDAKIAGRAVRLEDPEAIRALYAAMGEEGPGDSSADYFVADITEVVVTRLNDARNRLVIESWHRGRGAQRAERD